ncbi:MAG: hypothetical protein ACQGVK_23450 [Myxococcota bacterium]
MWAELQAQARLDDVGSGGLSGVNGEALATFGNSGGITSFTLMDAQAQPITNYSLSSESGAFHLYVPEARSGLLIGLALAVLLSGRGRSSRRSAPSRSPSTMAR